MYSVPYHRRNCQKLDRPNPKRPERTHVRLGGGYNYSDANKNSGIVWNEATFKEYIKDPKAKIPGTKMVFPGIKDEKEAEDLWSFLEQFGPDGKKK